jgi:membrane protein required for colicin V production
MPMTSADSVALALVAALVLLGALRGLVRDIAVLAGIIAGAWLAWSYGAAVGHWLAFMAVPGPWAGFLGYAVTFLSVVILAALVGGLVSRLMHKTPLGWLDRLLGAGLGLGKGLLLVWAIVSACLLVSPEGAAVVRSSPVVARIVSTGDGLLRPGDRKPAPGRNKARPGPVNRRRESLVRQPTSGRPSHCGDGSDPAWGVYGHA